MLHRSEKNATEDVLASYGFYVFEEDDGITTYSNNVYPGSEFALDWSRGYIPHGDLTAVLEDAGVNPSPIIQKLEESKVNMGI